MSLFQGVFLACRPASCLRVCLLHFSPFSFSPIRPAPPSCGGWPLSHSTCSLSRGLIFLFLLSHAIVYQFSCCVLIIQIYALLLSASNWTQLLPGDLIPNRLLFIDYLLWAGNWAEAPHAFHPVFPVLNGICLVSNWGNRDSEIPKDGLLVGWGPGACNQTSLTLVPLLCFPGCFTSSGPWSWGLFSGDSPYVQYW